MILGITQKLPCEHFHVERILSLYMVFKGYVTQKELSSSKIENISLVPRGFHLQQIQQGGESAGQPSTFDYLTAHFRVSLPFGKSRRAPREPKGQSVNKYSPSAYCGPITGCHSPPPLRRGRKKIVQIMHSAARGPEFKFQFSHFPVVTLGRLL